MNSKTLDRIRIAGIIILVLTTIVLVGFGWLGIMLPGVVFGIIVAVDLMTVLVMEIVAVKRAKQEENQY